MTEPAATPRHGLYFSVSVHARLSIDELAPEVSAALGAPLTLSTERGLQNDYVGEVMGLSLWLFVADLPAGGRPARFALIGQARHDGPDIQWVDVGPYVADLLSMRTGRSWSSGSGAAGAGR
jgi:hypothetical protein